MCIRDRYHIGTGGGTKEYANPHRSGGVVAAISSQYSSYCAPDRFVVHRVEDCRGGIPGHNRTDLEHNPWMSVDLGEGRSLVPGHYCLRHGSEPSNVLRYWMLQGSQDGQEWHTLRLHENDETLREPGWAVEAGERSCLVLQHGLNSSSECFFHHLLC
eukprot:TRINITY_DN3028_c0_g3_i2.p1 TRINITY_DN3028_c0_g3~~TRINITY_DN3028_c0_g3_i2.p1  ORF type:complete len:158 (-),score=25.25 TRINITY_DN3028_c0_g3_i2:338-811(-)